MAYSMRLSTRDLFATLTFVAIIAWCAGKVGYDSLQFWLSAAVTLLLAAAFVRWSAPERRGTAALVAGLPFLGFFTLCIGSIAAIVAAVLMVVATIIFAFVPPSSLNVRVRVAMLCVSAAFIYAYIYGNGDVRRILAARKQFPFESMDRRLDYEVTPAGSQRSPSNDSLILSKLDNDEQEYEQFVRAVGFGPVRMARPSAESIASTPLRDIEFDDLASGNDGDAHYWRAGQEGKTNGSIESAHEVTAVTSWIPKASVTSKLLASRSQDLSNTPFTITH